MTNKIEPIKNFSDISKESGKDQLISHWEKETGLPIETVNNLFEHFSLYSDGSLTKINESFTDYTKNKEGFSWERFKNNILRLGRDLADPDIRESKRSLLTNNLLATIKTEFGIPVDAKTLVEVLCAVMLKHNPNFNMSSKTDTNNTGYDFGANKYSRTSGFSGFSKGSNYTSTDASSSGPMNGESVNDYRKRKAEEARSRYSSENAGAKAGARPGSKYGPTDSNKKTGSFFDDLFNKSEKAKNPNPKAEAEARAKSAEAETKAKTEANNHTYINPNVYDFGDADSYDTFFAEKRWETDFYSAEEEYLFRFVKQYQKANASFAKAIKYWYAQTDDVYFGRLADIEFNREKANKNKKDEDQKNWDAFLNDPKWKSGFETLTAEQAFLWSFMKSKHDEELYFADAKEEWDNLLDNDKIEGIQFWENELKKYRNENSVEQEQTIQDVHYQQVIEDKIPKFQQQITGEPIDYKQTHNDTVNNIAQLLKNKDFVEDDVLSMLNKNKQLNESENFCSPALQAQQDCFMLLEAMDFTPINVSEKNSIEDNIVNAKHLVNLYEGLKNMLHERRNDFTNNYHLSSNYNDMMEYLKKETEYLSNFDNVVTIDTNYHMDILNDFVKSKYPNPLYRSYNSVKNLISDSQVLVFDLMVLINSYIVTNKEIIDFISRDKYLDYQNALDMLYGQIQSSRNNSRILFKNNLQINSVLNINIELEGIDNDKINLYQYPVSLTAALNMAQLIKAMSGDFNLKIRPIINLYITKTVELLISSEKKIIRKNNLRF